MIELKSVTKPPESPFEAMEAKHSEGASLKERILLPGKAGSASAEVSRSQEFFVAKGRSGPIASPFETVLDRDDRSRILETDLAPWRMICALRMRGPGATGAIGTGWLVGPRTVLTAGHCVYSTEFFGGWASSIEVIPGLNGNGQEPRNRPFGSVTSKKFSSVDRWVDREEADFDIGCIHLDEPLGDKVGWFALAAFPADELAGFLVNVSGYPADRGRGNEQYHHRNRVVRVTDRRLYYEVDTYGGQSGAPVWIHESEDGPPVAVGIHAYGIGGTPADLGITANSAPRIIPEVLDKVREWLAQNGQTGGG